MFPAVADKRRSGLNDGACPEGRPRSGVSLGVSLGVGFGLASCSMLAAAMPGTPGVVSALAATLAGAAAAWSAAPPGGRVWGYLTYGVSLGGALLVMVVLFAIPLDPAIVLGYWIGTAAILHWGQVSGVRRPLTPSKVGAVAAIATMLAWTAPSVAGAWSVHDPSPQTSAPQPGNGVTQVVGTHGFLLAQGVRILEADGHTDMAQFFTSADPTAPRQVASDGRVLSAREPYLWRLQSGAYDADYSLKSVAMPDHFFNWWTHSGKGLIAGPSAATWAEQQFDQAVALWRAGQPSSAMYHLGAAAHLVADACAPPHASVLLPNHRPYEEWVLTRQQRWAVHAGGIYADQFRQGAGHGGPEWSSGHTRGWVDECAHRAAPLTVNAAQPTPGSGLGSAYANTRDHFGDVQRLTAGYLKFFFDTVNGDATP